jgi:cystathionine beta-lyase
VPAALPPDPRFDRVELDRLRRRRTVKWSLYGPDVLAAWVAEMDFDVAAPVRAALHEAVDRDDLGYAEADLGELTRACSAHLAALHDWEVPPSRIFPVADVLSGVAGALDLTVPAAAPVVVPTPTYPPLLEIVEGSGRPAVQVPMADAGRAALDLDRIDAALAEGARAVLLCSPHNPRGRVFERVELPGRRHVPYASLAGAADHTVTVVSASKAWNLAGLRCAQVVTSNHDDAAAWRRLPVFAVPGPTPLGIAASVAAYSAAEDWRVALVAHLGRNRELLGELLAAHLPGVRHRPPEGTYLAWLDCSALGLADPAAHFLHHGRVALSDGPPFGAGYEQFVRLNFATSPELLSRIVEQMGQAVRAR